MRAVYKRELCSYFNSMTGWVFIAVLTAATGVYFMVQNLFYGNPYFSTSLGSILFLLMMMVPVLTMRSMAEERRSRTDQLLLTSPVSVGAVVLGKYLAMVTVLGIAVLIDCLCPLIIKLNGAAFLKADYASLLAFFLLGAVEIGVGLLVSALTESQVIAAAGTFALLLVLYLWDGLVSFLPAAAAGSLAGFAALLVLACFLLYTLSNSWRLAAGVLVLGGAVLAGCYFYTPDSFAGLLPDILGRFSLLKTFDAFALDHVFDLRGLLLYISLSALFVFLTVQTVQKRRWS